MERDCYCALAAGQSLRTVDGFPQSISHRTLHLALQGPAGFTLGQAVWWAQLQILRTSESLTKRVLKSRVVRDLPNHERWLRLVAKFVAKPEAADEFGLVADALLFSSTQGGSDRWDVLLGLPLNELINHCRRMWLDLLKASGEPFQPEELRHEGQRDALRRQATNVWNPMLPEGKQVILRTHAQTWEEWQCSSITHATQTAYSKDVKLADYHTCAF
jgi:hypothetical protein